MLNDDHPQRSEAKQVKKKLCMACYGPETDGCEILILDIESDLKDVDSHEVDDSDPVVLTPIAQLSQDLLCIDTFSVLGSTLYMFEDGYDQLKSAYAYDFSSSTSSSSVVKLERSSVRKLSDMWGPKSLVKAAATPDGERIVVYSHHIDYDYPFDKDNHIKRIDFEVYHPDLDSWVILPGLYEKLVKKYVKRSFFLYVEAFTFVNNSKMLILVDGNFFSFDLDDEEQFEWREVVDPDQWRVVYPEKEDLRLFDPCVLLGFVCVTPLTIFDTRARRSFWLPAPDYNSATMASAHITLLSGDSNGGGECTFARVHMGRSLFTHLPLLVVDVFSFNLDNIGADDLEIQFIKSSKFVLGTSGRTDNFAGLGIFPILAGIDMPSAGVPFRLLPDPERTGLRLKLESSSVI